MRTDRRFDVVHGERRQRGPAQSNFSLLRLSAPARLGIAAVVVLAMWAAVNWAWA